jgi:hypothetical protein
MGFAMQEAAAGATNGNAAEPMEEDAVSSAGDALLVAHAGVATGAARLDGLSVRRSCPYCLSVRRVRLVRPLVVVRCAGPSGRLSIRLYSLSVRPTACRDRCAGRARAVRPPVCRKGNPKP